MKLFLRRSHTTATIILVAFFSFIFIAQIFTTEVKAESENKISFKKFTDSKLNISFVAPKDAVVSQPKRKLTNPLLVNPKTVAHLKWRGMTAQVDTFELAFDLNQIDWLTAYTVFSDFKTGPVRTLSNRNDFIFGTIKYKKASDPADYATAFLAITHNNGYLITGDGIKSDPLVKTIVDTFTFPKDNIKRIDKTQTIKFAGHVLKFRDDFTIHDASKNQSIVKVITNASTIAESSTILMLKTGDDESHKHNLEKFSGELSNLKFTSEILRSNNSETAYLLKTPDDRNFVGFIRTLQSGKTVSLITPAINEDVNSWLSGKFYFINTLRALK